LSARGPPPATRGPPRNQSDQEKRLRQIKNKREIGCMSAARERGLKLLIQRVRVASEGLRELEGFETELGYILASSGFRGGRTPRGASESGRREDAEAASVAPCLSACEHVEA